MRKVVFIASGFLVSLLILAALVPYLIPTSAYREFAINVITHHINARVNMEKFRFQILPFPGFKITDFALISKEPPFQGQAIAEAGEIRGSLSPANLLKGRIVTSLDVDNVTIVHNDLGGETNLGMAFEEGIFPGEEGNIEVVSINLKHGRLNLLKNGRVVFIVSDLKLDARNLPFAGGLNLELKFAGDAADPNPSVSVPGSSGGFSRQSHISAAGQIFYDGQRREISARAFRFNISGMQTSADLSINAGAIPKTFDIHVASPDLNSRAIQPFLALFENGGQITEKITPIEGYLAADIVLKGSPEAYEVSLQLDATQAKVVPSVFFSKGAGLSLKTHIQAFVSPEEITIADSSIVFGKDTMTIKGGVKRDDVLSTGLTLTAKGLNNILIKPFFPILGLFDSIEGLDIQTAFKGSFSAAEPMEVSGSFKASSLDLAGLGLKEVEGSFVNLNDPQRGISFPTLKGKYEEGSLSGNGSISFGESTDIGLNAVIEHIDAGTIGGTKGAIAGDATVVVKVATSGADPVTLASKLKISGTLVVPDATIASAKPMSEVFSEALWNDIESKTKTKISSIIKEKLASSGDKVENLNASFEISPTSLELSSITWKTPFYDVSLKGKFDPEKMIKGEGVVSLAKPPTRLPITLGGTLPEIKFKLNLPAPSPIPPDLKPVTEKPVSPPVETMKAGGHKKEDTSLTVKHETAPKEEARPKPKTPHKEEEKPLSEEAEDVLKIIIGR